MSEISDSGTGTSSRSYSDSREEMHQLAISLGLESADDLAKERFKVDRKKLEAMLHCKCVLNEKIIIFILLKILMKTVNCLILTSRSHILLLNC